MEGFINMRKTERMCLKMWVWLLVTAWAACLASCYKSAPGTGPDADANADGAADPVMDRTDPVPDLPVDIPVEPDAPPFTGLDFIVSNRSSPVTGMTFYYTVWDWGVDSYPFSLDRVTYGEPEPVNMNRPWCSLACDEVSGGDDCCILCEDVIDAVRVLEPGESVRYHWDGTLWTMDYDRCTCGCHYPYAAPPGPYDVGLCTSTSIHCYDPGFCEPDENGIIWGAYLDPFYQGCSIHSFSIPEDSGEIIEFVFSAEDY